MDWQVRSARILLLTRRFQGPGAHARLRRGPLPCPLCLGSIF